MQNPSNTIGETKAHITLSQSKTGHQPPQASSMLLHSTAGNHKAQSDFKPKGKPSSFEAKNSEKL